MTISIARALVLVLASSSVSYAMAETSTVLIGLRHSKYPFQCHALYCFSPESEKRERLKLARDLVDQSCSPSSIKDLGLEGCYRRKDELSALEQCQNLECIKAACRKVEVGTGRCVGGMYFR